MTQLRLSALLLICAGTAYSTQSIAAAPIAPSSHTYYVKSDGNDSNDGRSDATAWRTISKVNSAVTTTGSDVYFKSGDVWTDQALIVDWSGTAQDRAVIGSYYIQGGQAFASEPSDSRLNPKDRTYPNGRATIQGSYRASCRKSGNITCLFGKSGAVPSSQDGGLVTIQGTSYVTVQSLTMRDSAGYGLLVDGNASSNICKQQTACQDYLILRDNLVTHAATSGIGWLEARYGVISGNEVEYANLSWKDGLNKSFGANITARRCDPCDLLIENNYSHDGYGENIGPYAVSYVLVRGNFLANSARVLIYFDGDADTVAEQNILAGGAPTDEPGLGDTSRIRTPGTSLAFVKESTTTSGGSSTDAAHRQIMRNNLVANFQTCIWPGINSSSSETMDGYFAGNTCIGANGKYGFRWGGSLARLDPSGVHVVNNIFATTSGAPGCDNSDPGSAMNLQDNYWVDTPSDTQCRAAGDTYGTFAGLKFGAHNFANSTKLDFPRYQWFAIQPGSEAATVGSTIMVTYLNAARWSWVLNQRTWMPDCQASQVSAAEFAKVLSTDYCGQPRSGESSSVGALEPGNSQQALAYQLSVD